MSSGGGRRNDEGHQGGAALVQGRAAVPIDRVVCYLKTGKDTKHGSEGVPVYLSAVLEYSPPRIVSKNLRVLLVLLVLEPAGNVGHDNKKNWVVCAISSSPCTRMKGSTSCCVSSPSQPAPISSFHDCFFLCSVTPWLRALHQSAIASKLVQQSNVENMGEYCRHHDEGQ
ncbi:unnamed protein product [Urochloa humidicola]